MSRRILLLRRALLIGLGLLVLRLGSLQLLQGSMYRELAEKNRLRLVPQAAPRGLVFDRDGHVLATNHTQFRVAVIPQEMHNRRAVMTRLGPLMNLPPGELDWRFNEDQSLPFLPASLVEHVPKAVALRIEEAHLNLPGILVETVITRHYPLGSIAAHLLGYVGQPDPELVPTLKPYGVTPRELVGRAGLERELDAYLRGRVGGSLIEVNHLARQVRVVGHREPLAGESVVLTLNAPLQALIEQQFSQSQQPGSCVVLKPQTGELLAMVSSPTFDPEAFATQDLKTVRRFFSDSRAPRMNRATDGMYLPGSIVKPVTAATALELGVITPTTTIICPGSLTIGDRVFHCWNHAGHGPLTVREALMQSCNVYFMEVGRRLGLDRLRNGFLSVGFGRRTGYFPQEQTGYLPSRRHLSEGEVALLAMGQGDILLTPLQAAVMVSAIANQGWLVEPWLVKTIGDYPVTRAHLRPVGWSKQTLAVVREGMLAVVNAPGGTGATAHSDTVRITGKTGTAQTGSQGRPHGWFIGFCPTEEPLVAMAIVAEHGGSGGEFPAAVAKMICEYVVSQHADDARHLHPET